MQRFQIQVARTPGQGGRAVILAMLLVVGGVIASLVKAAPSPLVAAVVGVLLHVWLFKITLTTLYWTYLVVDDHGVEHVHAPGTTGRASRYAWHQINERLHEPPSSK